MTALKDCGVDSDALLAKVDPATGPTWYPLSHAGFDGVGAFGYLLRRHGHPDLEVLPQQVPGLPPRLLPLLRAGARFSEFPIGRGVSLRPPSRSLKPVPRNIAWRILDSAQTAQVVARAEAEGVGVSAWLFFALDRALEPLLDKPELPSRWMIVNTRGVGLKPVSDSSMVQVSSILSAA
jgi:hypothetical protein